VLGSEGLGSWFWGFVFVFLDLRGGNRTDVLAKQLMRRDGGSDAQRKEKSVQVLGYCH
jgi:hypothetical protein